MENTSQARIGGAGWIATDHCPSNIYSAGISAILPFFWTIPTHHTEMSCWADESNLPPVGAFHDDVTTVGGLRVRALDYFIIPFRPDLRSRPSTAFQNFNVQRSTFHRNLELDVPFHSSAKAYSQLACPFFFPSRTPRLVKGPRCQAVYAPYVHTRTRT